MSRNDTADFTERLYARLPGHYRVSDQEQGQPLRALLRVVAEQVSTLRLDIEGLWDNFFIETCDDWVVPYIGALVGANLLAQPVGQSNRLDIRNTIVWRSTRGTPAMLTALSRAITGWPVDLTEFFHVLGWYQNMNHVRLERQWTADLRDPWRLNRIGHADDLFAHTADFRVSRPLDHARVSRQSLGIGISAWGTPGRHQIKNLGFFARRLQTFRITGGTPASVSPGAAPQPDDACFTFDPLFHETPLFVDSTGAPLTREAFDREPWKTFGSDVAVRQFGVLLASEVAAEPSISSSRVAFSFNESGAGLQLHPTAGIRLLNPHAFELGAAHFTIAAEWRDGGSITTLGRLSTLLASRSQAAFDPGSATASTGALAISVTPGAGGLPPAPAARFPGGVIAVRADRAGAQRTSDALYIYLPSAFLQPGEGLVCHVADDGSTYSESDLQSTSLLRRSEGQIYPPRLATQSTAPARDFVLLNRAPIGVQILDPTRFGGLGVLVRVDIAGAEFQAQGAIATVDQSGTPPPGIPAPDPWPAFTYVASDAAVAGDLPEEGLLSIHVVPLSGDFVPAFELVVVNRRGDSLLVYTPELAGVDSDGVDLLVADDGSTYLAPSTQAERLRVAAENSFRGLPLTRASLGQVAPISGIWPIQQRRPVGMNLCRCERRALLAPGELGIDPELGRFAFAPDDPSIGLGALSVDYVEAFSDRIGARNFDRRLTAAPTRVVSQSADTVDGLPVHIDLADALANAVDEDVIEFRDSATYFAAAAAPLTDASVRRLTIRAAANCRPCLSFYAAANTPSLASLQIAVAMESLHLNGLLISGGPVRLEFPVNEFHLTATTLDPRSAAAGASLIALDPDPDTNAEYLLCRTISGGLRLGRGVEHITIADSILDASDGVAIGESGPDSPPEFVTALTVQLERVTVFGRIHCDVLHASDSILDDLVFVEDQQAGCIRFTRFETGSILPRRFQCVPTEAQMRTCFFPRCVAPVFASRLFGRPSYGQLSAGCPPEILTAAESGAEPGAFAGSLNTIRVANLGTKLREFAPVGLTAVLVAET